MVTGPPWHMQRKSSFHSGVGQIRISLFHIEGLKIKGVECWVDCEAPWGKFVILFYINKNLLDLVVSEITWGSFY